MVKILSGMALYLAIMSGWIIQQVLFGNLRVIEVEHLYERSWFSVMDTFLALTMFRDEFDVMFVSMFGFLLFVKVFHWICGDRVDFMEQSPDLSLSFHLRIFATVLWLSLLDISFVIYAAYSVLNSGPTMLVVFGFEFALLLVNILSTFVKYVFHTIDLQNEAPWDEKSKYFLYIDLVVDFLKLVSYGTFLAIIISYYGFPLHTLRDLYVTMRSFFQRCQDVIKYHRATANMNQRYPTATDEELNATDHICIVCREEMTLGQNQNAALPLNGENLALLPKKLPCGHIFHFRCLRSWLERQQACPTCRRSVLETNETNNPPNAAPPPAQQQQQQQLPEALRNRLGQLAMIPAIANLLPQQQPVQQPQLNQQPIMIGDQQVFITPLGPINQHLPQDFSPVLESLSEEELKLLEGQTRDHIIERLKAIYKIQEQLNGVSTQLTQIINLMPQNQE